MTTKKDRYDNVISNGTTHAIYNVYDFAADGYDFIESSVSFSNTSESVYVKYRNTRNLESVTIRFSWHISNDVEFGEVLTDTDTNEILYRLGVKGKRAINNTRPSIMTQFLKKKDVAQYEEAPLTIQEMYALGIGADLSSYKGKVAKGSRHLIQGEKVEEIENNIGVSFEYYDI